MISAKIGEVTRSVSGILVPGIGEAGGVEERLACCRRRVIADSATNSGHKRR